MKKSLILLPLMMGLVISTNVIAENQNIEPARAAATCEVHDTEEDHGFIVADKNKGYEGDKINLTVAPDLGYEIVNVWANDQLLEAQKEGQYTFNMKAGTNKVHAEFGFNLMQTTVKFPEKFQGHYFLSHKLAAPGTEAEFRVTQPNNHSYQHITKVTFNGVEMKAFKKPGDVDDKYWYKYIVNNERNEIEVFMHEDPYTCHIYVDVQSLDPEFQPVPTATANKEYVEMGEKYTINLNYNHKIGYLKSVQVYATTQIVDVPFVLSEDKNSFVFDPWLYLDENQFNEFNRDFYIKLILNFKAYPPRETTYKPQVQACLDEPGYPVYFDVKSEFIGEKPNDFYLYKGQEYLLKFETTIPEEYYSATLSGVYAYVSSDIDKKSYYQKDEDKGMVQLEKDEKTGYYKFIAGKHAGIEIRYSRPAIKLDVQVVGNDAAVIETGFHPNRDYHPGDNYFGILSLRQGYEPVSITLDGENVEFTKEDSYNSNEYRYSCTLKDVESSIIKITIKKQDGFVGDYKWMTAKQLIDAYNVMKPNLVTSQNKSVGLSEKLNHNGLYKTLDCGISQNNIKYEKYWSGPSSNNVDFADFRIIEDLRYDKYGVSSSYTRNISNNGFTFNQDILGKHFTENEKSVLNEVTGNHTLQLHNDPRLDNFTAYANNLYDLYNEKLVTKFTQEIEKLLSLINKNGNSKFVVYEGEKNIICDRAHLDNTQGNISFSFTMQADTKYGYYTVSFSYGGDEIGYAEYKLAQGHCGCDFYIDRDHIVLEDDVKTLKCPLFNDFNAFCSKQTTNKQ